MANFNKVILCGNLTRDIELRNTQGGLAVAKFGMAINRKSSSKNGDVKESTCFVDCTAFGKSAEVLQQWLKKGDPVLIDGRLEYSSWQTDDGSKRSKLEVIVDAFQFMGSKDKQQDNGSGARPAFASDKPINVDDIPF